MPAPPLDEFNYPLRFGVYRVIFEQGIHPACLAAEPLGHRDGGLSTLRVDRVGLDGFAGCLRVRWTAKQVVPYSPQDSATPRSVCCAAAFVVRRNDSQTA